MGRPLSSARAGLIRNNRSSRSKKPKPTGALSSKEFKSARSASSSFSSRVRSSTAFLYSEMSLTIPVKIRRSPSRVSLRASSMGNMEPSLWRPWTSVIVPTIFLSRGLTELTGGCCSLRSGSAISWSMF